MKKVLLISDTHNNQIILRKVILNEKKVSHIFHLGDFYEDLENNFDLINDKIISRVPGINNPKYFSKQIPSVLSITLDNWTFSLAHTLEDLIKKGYKADFYLFGHTHITQIFSKNNIYHINPGHLKSEIDRGYEASYCVLNVFENKINIKFITFSGNIFKEITLKK